MSLIIDQCTEYYDERRTCIAKENGKIYRLENVSGYQIRKVKVDKCFPQRLGEKRCDYLMVVNTQDLKRAIFIELKGGALNDAVKQIHSTIIYVKTEFLDFQVDARIVGTRNVPAFKNTPDYLKLSREIGSSDRIKISTNREYSENI